MIQNEKEQSFIKSYLLGVLDEAQQQELDQRLWADESFCEELQIAEDELVDDYLAGRLAPAEREQFEKYFLAAPERQKDLSFARVFKRYVADSAIEPVAESENVSQTAAQDGSQTDVIQPLPPSPPLWKRPEFMYAIFLVALVAAIAFFVIPRYMPNGREKIEQELAQLNESNRRGQSPTGTSPETYRTTLALGGQTRGTGDTTTLQISPQAKLIELKLEVPPDDYKAYQATFVSENAELYTVKDLRALPENDSRFVHLYLLPAYLPGGDYQIRLSGTTPDGKTESLSSYPFRVVVQ